MERTISQEILAPKSSEDSEQIPALSVVIPAYNEGSTVGHTLESLSALARQHCWEVIIVDDGSSDDTVEQVRQHCDEGQVRLISHPYNRGYGAAIKTGIRSATADLIATMDADGQHMADQIMLLLPYAVEYELVVGMRTALLHSDLWRMPGKWFLNRFANYVSGQRIPDLNSGMRLFHAAIIEKYLHLCPDGFSFSTTSTLALLNRGYGAKYVPISVAQRHPAGRSTVTVSTGFDTLVLILRLASLFQPLRVFIPASGFFIALGIFWGLPYVLLQQGVSVGALLLILSGFMLFFFGLLTDQVSQLRLEKYE